MNPEQLNQLNNMINNMNNINICDAECQKKKKVERLRTQYNNAKNKLKNAPQEIIKAREAYYLEDPSKGANYYAQYMEKEIKEKGEKKVKDWNESLINPLVDKIKSKISYLTSQEYYKKNVKNLYDFKSSSLDELKQEVEDTNSKKYTNDRLAYYYDYNTSLVNSFNDKMFYLYWILVAIAVFLFLYKKQFKNIAYYPFIVLILVSPFIMHKFYDLAFSNIKHAKINNLFFIYFVIIISLFFIFNFLSNLPFSNIPQPQ